LKKKRGRERERERERERGGRGRNIGTPNYWKVTFEEEEKKKKKGKKRKKERNRWRAVRLGEIFRFPQKKYHSLIDHAAQIPLTVLSVLYGEFSNSPLRETSVSGH